MAELHEWENIRSTSGSGQVSRMRVPTGWIYRVSLYATEPVSVIFVPCEPMDYINRMFPDGVQKG